MSECLIALGSNLGNRRQHLETAVEAVAKIPNTRLLHSSRLHETAPVGRATGIFLNGCLSISTRRSPGQLINDLNAIETACGRNRQAASDGNRPVDLDILLYDQLVLTSDLITVPHPRMSFRRFVLEPAAEFAGSLQHPLFRSSIAELLADIDLPGRQIGIHGPPGGEADLESALPALEQQIAAAGWTLHRLDSRTVARRSIPDLNLLIESAATPHGPDELFWPDYRGPRWQTGLSGPAEFVCRLPDLIRTAIESMQPLASGPSDPASSPQKN